MKLINTDVQTCLDYYLPTVIMFALGENYTWEMEEITTADGYQLTMKHIVGDDMGNPLDISNGPLLLVHGLYTDSSAWFNRSTEDESALPIRLANLGYDVYMANVRGTEWSKTHSDPTITSAEYWDFDITEIAQNDIPAFISTILAKRVEANLDCQKVNVMGHSYGAASSLLTAATFPFTAEKYINALNPIAPCMIPNLPEVVNAGLADFGVRRRNLSGVDIAADGSERTGRSLTTKDKARNLSRSSDKSPKKVKARSPQKCYKNWNRGEYNADMRDVRAELGYRTEEYAQFYQMFKAWKSDYGKECKCDEAWKESLRAIQCEINPCSMTCQPPDQFIWGSLVELLISLEIYSLYSPTWNEPVTGDLAVICDALPPGSAVCDYLSGLVVGYPSGT